MSGEVLGRVSAALWGEPFIAALGVCGLYLTHCGGYIQFLRPRMVIKDVFGELFSQKEGKTGGVTPFEALCTALAGTVGTGNVTGVAVALTLGGPGAVFWMWVSALIGMGTKYAEILLSVKFRERGADGAWVGGPMVAIKNGLGERFYPLAVLFAVSGALAAFGTGNMVQVGSIVGAVTGGTAAVWPEVGNYVHFPAIIGFVTAVLVMLSAAGGGQSRGRVLAFIVPVMAAGYIVGAGAVIAANLRFVPGALAAIFEGALSRRAFLSGAAGRALTWGFRRGMLSHEAGLGSSPIAHASANAKSPASEGLFGIFEVAADTLVISTVTALMLLTSGAAAGDTTGAGAVMAALSGVLGARGAAVFLAAAITLFAVSSILSWSIYGEKCAAFLLGEKCVTAYRAVFVCAVFASSVVDFTAVIDAADILNALMTAPNLVSLLLLAPVVKRETRALNTP